MSGTRLLQLLRLSLLLGWFLASCGGEAGDTENFDSNTNWLKACGEDADCGGALSCLCGICTQPCGTDPECGLLSRAECRASASAQCATEPSAGAICVLACSGASGCPATFTCDAGQCVPPAIIVTPVPPASNNRCDFISWDQLYRAVQADLVSALIEDRPFLRYITLANTVDAGDCGDATLDDQRQGLSRLLNSLSTGAVIRQPQPIQSDTETYRIDLRDYGWDLSNGPTELGGSVFPDRWELLASASPYAVEFQGDNAVAVQLMSSTLVPVLFGDALLAAASQAAVYYGLLGIPPELAQLRSNLGVDLQGDRAQGRAVRAGYSENNRELIAERHPQGTSGRYYWQIADFGPDEGGAFTDPLAELSGESEIVYSLPNGLLAFALYDAAGSRIDVSSVLMDAPAAGSLYRIARSALRRYSSGVQPNDQVRESVLASPASYSPQVVQGVTALYPAAFELSEILARDRLVYAMALGQAGLSSNGIDPLNAALRAFDADVDLRVIAGDLLDLPASLVSNTTRLDPALSGIDDGIPVDRDDWNALYVHSLCITSVAQENRPTDAVCIEAGAL